MEMLKSLFPGVARFLTTDIWRIPLRERSALPAAGIRVLRMALLAVRGFQEDRCPLRASSLTFYTLLSIVPVAAMAFGIAKGFGFEKNLERQIYGWLPGQEEVAARLVTFANSFLETVQGGLIAGIGLIALIWAVVKVLGNIESALNEIWQVEAARSPARKFGDYLALMLISPILVLLASSATVVVSRGVTEIVRRFEVLDVFSPMIFIGLKIIPYFLLWVLFTVLYMVMPNTRVRFGPAFLAGIVAGTAYQVAQWGYIAFQVGASKYNAVYGSFAALPLFLIWLQISWVIVLFGAEISYAAQNVDGFEFGPDSANASPSFRKLVALRTVHRVVRRFVEGEPAPDAVALGDELRLPIRLVRLVVADLLECGILVETVSPETDGAPTYVPGMDPRRLTVNTVLQALESRGVPYIPMDEGPELENFVKVLDSFRDILDRAPTNVRIQDIEELEAD